MAKPHQVFISYSREDEAFAKRLADELVQRDIRVWIDINNIRFGKSWVDEIDNGLKQSSHFILILTPTAMDSKWVTQERNVALDKAIRDKITFIPLLIKEFKIDSPILNSFQRILFADGFENGFRQLLLALDVSTKGIKDTDNFTIPYLDNSEFVEQDNQLNLIHRALNQGKPVGLVGIAGIGKTQTVVKYAHTYRYNYRDGVYWINAAQSLERGLLEIAEDRGLAAINSSPSQIARSVWNEFSRKSNALVVVDNLNGVNDLDDYPVIGNDLDRSKTQCKLLFTIENQDKTSTASIPTLLIDLSIHEALRLLLSRSNPNILANIDDPERIAAEEICYKQNKHALSLELVAAYLHKVKGSSFKDYHQKLENGVGRTITFDKLPPDLSETLSTILHLQWEQLNGEEQNILMIASLFREERYIPLIWLDLLSVNEINDETIEPLLQLSLCKKLTNGQIYVHTLIHQYISTKIDGAKLESFQTNVENNLIDNLANSSGNYKQVITAGDLLINLDWIPHTMRGPIISAHWKVLKNENYPEPVRREASFKLMKLGWLSEKGSISNEDFLLYLETTSRFLEKPDSIKHQLSIIAQRIDRMAIDALQTEDHRAALDYAHFLNHHAALQAKLSYLFNDPSIEEKNANETTAEWKTYLNKARSEYDRASTILDKHKNTSEFQLQDYKLEARILLGMGILIRDCDNDLEQAKIMHQKSFDIAQQSLKDIILLTTIGKELSGTLSMCKEWDEADIILQNIFVMIESLKDVDSRTYAIYSSKISEVLSVVHWYKGEAIQQDKRPHSQTNALRSFLLAYVNAINAVHVLEEHGLLETVDMIYARFNAAECLKSLVTFQGHRELHLRISDPIEEARIHWQEVVRIADLLGLISFEQEAREYLEEIN